MEEQCKHGIFFCCKEGFVEMMVTESKLLKHANEVYIIGEYRLFEEHFMRFPDYCQELVVCNEGEYVYEVWCLNITAFRHTVVYNESTLCTCKMFNEVGILCSYCLCIFNILCVQAIPHKYILKRWTKDIDLSLGSSNVSDVRKVSKNNILGYSA
ncbi:hypothetical protein M9H77_13407 [Catharanthus roseus]|uniref:Uncharacterized protein n=1 Tax=Catharanthus roseus TaxID=4058 RepID=A0ACC0BKC1_CATRO|nr:hypothetical protein M9H77_13407 [Catharanthus roseus]